MADHSNIEWTDATWNPITGCTLVDEGCRNCYAADLATTRLKNHPSRKGLARKNAAGESKFTGEVRLNEQWLDQPLRWRIPRRIFVCAHGDLFHESVPDEWIDRVFAVMALAPQHTFQVLTKRPERARAYLTKLFVEVDEWDRIEQAALGFGATIDQAVAAGNLFDKPLSNLHLGTSISDQASADTRIPALLQCPAALRFVSAEPLLGPVDIAQYMHDSDCDFGDPDLGADICLCRYRDIQMAGDGMDYAREVGIDWVIVGGESGPKARHMHPDLARSLRDQCVAAGVDFFFKQWGEWVSAMQLAGTTGISSAPSAFGNWAHPHRRRVRGGALDGACFEGVPDGHDIVRVGKKRSGRLLDGREWNEMPGVQP